MGLNFMPTSVTKGTATMMVQNIIRILQACASLTPPKLLTVYLLSSQNWTTHLPALYHHQMITTIQMVQVIKGMLATMVME